MTDESLQPDHLILRSVAAFGLVLLAGSIALYLMFNIAGNGSLLVDILTVVASFGLVLVSGSIGQLVLGGRHAI